MPEIKAVAKKIFVAGVYLRLSVKDDADQNSIQNQREIIDEFLSSKPDIKIFKYYIDNGISSFDHHRPAFEEMNEDIKSGMINTVIVKDISRFGRDYIATGTFLESIYPLLGVRFISVSDGFDTMGYNNLEYEVPIRSLINHFYSQDISIKVRSVIEQKQKTGEYIAARIPYGYKKEILGGYTKYRIDGEKAAVVKTIFKKTLEGSSYYEIAGYLNSNGIKSPGNGAWTIKAVSRIVNNRFYTGVLETGKTKNTLGGIKRLKNIDKSDWITINDHHEAIIDTEMFEVVQTFRDDKNTQIIPESKLKLEKSSDASFNDILYCGDCNRKMKKQSWNNRTYYVCPKYGETKGACSLKSWREDRLIDELKNNIRIEVEKAESQKIEKLRDTSDYKLKHEKLSNDIDRLKKLIEYYIRFGEVFYDYYMDIEGLYQADLKRLMKYKNEKIGELQDALKVVELEIENLGEMPAPTHRIYMECFGNKNVDEFSKEDYARIIKEVKFFNEKIEIQYGEEISGGKKIWMEKKNH